MFLKWRNELNKLKFKVKEKKNLIWIGKYFQMSKLPNSIWFICIKMFKYSS